MNKMILLTLSLFIFSKAVGQLQNGSFSDWEIISSFGQSYENPSLWQTNNENDVAGFAITPVLKAEINGNAYAAIRSHYTGIDALTSGFCAQTISLNNLSQISYKIKCDSIFKAGACRTIIKNKDGDEIFYEDSITVEMDSFEIRTIQINPDWQNQTDSIEVVFEAFGYIFALEPEKDAYAIMWLDDVDAHYLLSTKHAKSSPSLDIYPNPTTSCFSMTEVELFFENYRVYNSIGQVVSSGLKSKNICLDNEASGIYYLVTKDGAQTILKH